jgi:hypothetical protein
MSWATLRSLCTLSDTFADSESEDICSVNNERSRATVTLFLSVPNAFRMAEVIRCILGYAYLSQTPVTKMRRVLPLQHLSFTSLFATEISSIQGRGPVRGVSFNESRVPSRIHVQAYNHYRLVVLFESLPYDVLRDQDEQPSELYRFTEYHMQLGVENIIRPGNTFKWLTGTPLAGQPIPVGDVTRAAKGIVTFIWRNVPRAGLFGGSGRSKPSNILDGISRVNRAQFAGFPPGELLLLPPKFHQKIIPSDVGNRLSGQATSFVHYDVELPMSWISPPYDSTVNVVGPEYAYRGHNLFPLPPGQAGANAGLWYPANRTGNPGSATHRYDGYDFNLLLRLMGTN